jgi:hypothetical protein
VKPLTRVDFPLASIVGCCITRGDASTKDKIEEASQALTQALDERVLDGDDARTLAMKEGLKDKKKLLQFKKEEQEKKHKARELEQKRREARGVGPSRFFFRSSNRQRGTNGIWVRYQPPPPPRSEEATWLYQAKDSLASNPHQFRIASDLLNQVAKSLKTSPEVKQEVKQLLQSVTSQIEREDNLLTQASQALLQRDCNSADPLFDQVIAIGDHLGEPMQGKSKASDPSQCEKDPGPIVQQYLIDAEKAFGNHQWQTAKSLYELVSKSTAATPAQIALAKSKIETAEKNLAAEAKRKEDEKLAAEDLARRTRKEDDLWGRRSLRNLTPERCGETREGKRTFSGRLLPRSGAQSLRRPEGG